MNSLDPADAPSLTKGELLRLCAVDNRLYGKTFFPRACRQNSPLFHEEMDEALFSHDRFVAFKCFRGSAKTTKLRVFLSKRIAYGISHTILVVSNSQDHAAKTIEWLKKAVEFNTTWAQTFDLKPGAKWTGTDIEIIHGVDQYPIRVIAVGITGQIRGFNIEDFRPDLILVDDPENEETTGSAEQLKKTADLFFGALIKSLAPRSEAPFAKVVLLQTPLAKGDLCDVASQDPQWRSLTFGCFDAKGQSRWPERWTTKELLEDKEAHMRRNQLALWMREMECEIVPDGGASFIPDNIRMYDLLPDQATYIITIDPASSDAKSADDQVVMLTALWRDRFYVIDYTAEKGEMPEAVSTTILQWARGFNILGIWVESISYQRILAHFLEQEMRKHRTFIPVHRVKDQRSKADRIVQAISKVTAYGLLHVRPTHQKLIAQYYSYSPKSKAHDDVIDCLAMAIDAGMRLGVQDWIDGEATRVNEPARKQIGFRQCP